MIPTIIACIVLCLIAICMCVKHKKSNNGKVPNNLYQFLNNHHFSTQPLGYYRAVYDDEFDVYDRAGSYTCLLVIENNGIVLINSKDTMKRATLFGGQEGGRDRPHYYHFFSKDSITDADASLQRIKTAKKYPLRAYLSLQINTYKYYSFVLFPPRGKSESYLLPLSQMMFKFTE